MLQSDLNFELEKTGEDREVCLDSFQKTVFFLLTSLQLDCNRRSQILWIQVSFAQKLVRA